MAEVVGADHHELKLTLDDLFDFLPEMVRLQDEPIADPVCVPVYYVSKLARDNGVIVCQVGEGADELFWGYPRWKRMRRLQQMADWPLPKFLKKTGVALVQSAGKEKSSCYEGLNRSDCGHP